LSLSKSPHVLLIPSWYPTEEEPLGGIFFSEQAHMIKKAGIRTGVIYPEIRPIKEFSWSLFKKNYFQSSHKYESDLSTYRSHGWNLFPGFLKGTMKLWVSQAQRLFKSYVKKEGLPTIIHAQSAIWAGVAAAEISRQSGIPYIIQEHRDLFLHPTLFKNIPERHWSENLIERVLENASEVIAVSQALKKGLEKYLSPSSKIVQVLPNFIDVEGFKLTPRPSLNQPFVFLTLAGLNANKNIDLLLRAFKHFHQKEPNSRLLIGGDGKEMRNLKKLCEELELTTPVQFLGWVPRHELDELFSRAHAFVLPSQYETFGVVFIEALAMGLPVIGTACGGPEDIITPEVGILLKQIDEMLLFQAMIELKASYKRYNPLNLKNYALRNFGREAVTKKWLDLYNFG
jgi:glycosyltransferase involved in cell wall biosynthesis